MNPLHPVVAGDLRKRRAHRRSNAAGAVIDELERRLFLSGTVTPIASFNGVDGANPIAVVQDSSGNLFGITYFTYASPGANPGPGVFFEIPANTGTIKDLNVVSTNGSPVGLSDLIIDSSDNLYGVASIGTANGPKAVVELAAGTTTAITLATFAADETGQLTAVDSAGDLFGIGGTSDGTFEVVKNSGMITPLADVNDQLQQTIPDLELGPDGNLYGVSYGAATTEADLFEITPSNGNLQILAAFDPTTSGDTPEGLTFDSSGNIWGFCQQGGPGSDGTYGSGTGTVWEFPLPVTSANPTISFVAQFTQATGLTVVSRPAFDSTGSLYGLTEDGGANGNGTIFYLPAGSTTLTDLYDWLGNDPDLPEGIVTTSNGVAAVEPTTATPAITTEGLQITPAGTELTKPQRVLLWNSIFNQLSTLSSDDPGTIFAIPINQIIDQKLQQFYDELVKAEGDQKLALEQASEAYVQATKTSPAELHHVERPAVKTAISGELASIKAMLSTVSHDLGAAKPQVNKDNSDLALETKETNLIAALNTQLAGETNSAKQAAIQKKITADTAVLNKATTQESTVYNTALAALDNIQTLQGNISAALAALPAPFASLSGVISTLPALLTPGKKASAVVIVTNTGNAGTPPLSFQAAISARPQGTDGSTDITLANIVMKVHLKAGASAPVHLSFMVPKGFAAGTYSLVVEPLPDSIFTGAPTPIVSTATFTVP
jgi:hypothetical protein